MNITIQRGAKNASELGQEAAAIAGEAISVALAARGAANIILATGVSQFSVLDALAKTPGIDWSLVTMFHLDEYIGLLPTHPASFRRYLRERFIDRVPALKASHLIAGDAADPAAECARLGALIAAAPIDVALLGIGENGHLAFNDPPADFTTDAPYLIAVLDEVCRRQQLAEGWFDSIDVVPAQAITMSIRQILKSRRLVVTAPDHRKAMAVKLALEGPLSNRCPASVLRGHRDCHLFLDAASAALLKGKATG